MTVAAYSPVAEERHADDYRMMAGWWLLYRGIAKVSDVAIEN